MAQEWVALIVGPLQRFSEELLSRVPNILAALLLLLVGMVVARLARTATNKFLTFSRVDQYTEKIKLNEVLSRLGFGQSPTFIMGFLVYWLFILVFVVSAANAVHLDVVSQLLERFVLFIPRLISAILVVAVGLLLGNMFGEIVQNAATANRLRGAVVLAKAARLVVVVFASVMGLEQIGIDTSIVSSSVQIVLATIGLGLAMAFGLGGRDAAAEIIRDLRSKQEPIEFPPARDSRL